MAYTAEDFNMFEHTGKTGQEQRHTCDQASASLGALAKQCSQKMTDAFKNGQMQEGAYFAETAQALTNVQSAIAEVSNTLPHFKRPHEEINMDTSALKRARI